MPSSTSKLAAIIAMLAAVIVAAFLLGMPKATTTLVIEISGGFAYVQTKAEEKLEIAYLNTVKLDETDTAGNTKEVCNVEQVGTELQVLRGDIVDAQSDPNPTPDDRIFNLDNAVVRFPALETANLPLTPVRGHAWPPTPLQPVDPTKAGEWQDLKFVPSIKDHVAKDIDPAWRTSMWVNGYVVLNGGTIAGTIPTDPTAQQTVFRYEQGANTTKAASTDKLIYTVSVPDDKIVITASPRVAGPTAFKQLVIKPHGNKPVRLRLRGLHATHSPASYADGQELTDFCAFNALLPGPVDSKNWLRIYYVKPPYIPPPGTMQPSPGYYCDGNWF
jgi:hypothetical protein